MKNAVKTVERAAVQALVDHFYENMADPAERVKTLQKIADLIPFFYRELSSEHLESVKNNIKDPDSRGLQLLHAMINDTDPEYQIISHGREHVRKQGTQCDHKRC